jgi:hypothetical protein
MCKDELSSMRVTVQRQLLTLALVAALLPSCTASALRPLSAAAPSVARHRALWVWDRGAAAEDPGAQARLLAFANKHAIDTFYYSTEELLRRHPAALASFVQAAAARGVGVELLFANNRWVYPQNQAQAASVVDQAVRFVSALPGARPTALHFDIEAYRLPEWKAGRQKEIEGDYLALLQKLAVVKGSLPVHVDIPFWFYRTPFVAPSGVTGPFDRAVLAVVDGCTIMDYRNAAGGLDGIVADGQGTMAAAEAAGKPLLVGVETNRIDPAYVTFYRLGDAALGVQLSRVDEGFDADKEFAGTAIEDYEGYREMGP